MKKDFPAIAEQYITDVLTGTQPACKTVKQAIDRHVKDLARSDSDPSYPYYFKPEAGARVCRLMELLRPSKWPKRIQLQPWQVCMTTILYGWLQREDGMRRFRTGFIMLPRKQGKSYLLSGFALNALVADNENGAEVYSAALVEEQARRVFDEAVAMVRGTPEMRDEIKQIGAAPCRRLRVESTNSEMRPLSRDKDAVQGTFPSFASCDEVHVWKGRGVWDDIRYGMGARQQPLLLAITTAPTADDTTSICNTLLEMSLKLLEGALTDDGFFCWITSLDPEDAWDDEATWIKACPNLGVTVPLSAMRQMAVEAKNSPEALHAFKRYNLNLRVDALEQPISAAAWKACTRPEYPELPDWERAQRLNAEMWETHKGRICFGALDLASIDDTSAYTLCFPPMEKGELWRFLTYYWIPADNIEARTKKHLVPYQIWKDQGFLITTPGETTDFDFIATKILELDCHFDQREIIYDPALAVGLAKKLLTGVQLQGTVKRVKAEKLVKFAQTMLNYSAPCGDFVRTIKRRELQHNGDPVTLWQMTNLRWIKNATGLFMPDKLKSAEKIDGAVTHIMSLGRANHPDNARLLHRPKVTVLQG